MSEPKPQNDRKNKASALPLSHLDNALKGLIGTPGNEVDAQEQKWKRRKKRAKKSKLE